MGVVVEVIMLCQSKVGIVVIIVWSQLGLHGVENIGCEGCVMSLQWHGLCVGASVIGFVWLGGARAIEQSSEQGGLTKI